MPGDDDLRPETSEADPLARSWAHELGLDGATAVCVMPGWLRSEMMLDRYGVTEEAWRDACAADTTGYR